MKDKKSALGTFKAMADANVIIRCSVCNGRIDANLDEEDLVILENPPRAYHERCYKKAFPTEYNETIGEEEVKKARSL